MNKIYVLSGTGTSLKVAKDMTKGMENTELLSIPKLMKSGDWSIEGEKVGFVFPCYYGEMPQIVKRFIEGAKTIEADYFFCIATAGGNTGYSLTKLGEALQKKGKKLQYGQSIIVSSNYMNGWYYNMIIPKSEELKKRLEDAKKKSIELGRDVMKGRMDIEKEGLMGYIMPQILSPSRYCKDTRPWDSEFAVVDKCNGCGTCEKVCAVDNISLQDQKPSFNHNCMRCMACVQYCSKSAFTIEGKPMDKTKYSHPTISLAEICQFNN